MPKTPTVEQQVEEHRHFVTTDGKCHDDLDKACDHQEVINFRDWCFSTFRGGEWGPDMIATAVLESWEVVKK